MLKECQRTTLFSFLDAVRKLLAEGIEQHSLQELEAEVNLALALMERDFLLISRYTSPITHTLLGLLHVLCFPQVITLHLLRHVVSGMKRFGPIYGSWMYGYERFNSWLHRRVMNRRFPEATLMETYRVSLEVLHGLYYTYIYSMLLGGC